MTDDIVTKTETFERKTVTITADKIAAILRGKFMSGGARHSDVVFEVDEGTGLLTGATVSFERRFNPLGVPPAWNDTDKGQLDCKSSRCRAVSSVCRDNDDISQGVCHLCRSAHVWSPEENTFVVATDA